ncbi:MAG TPA: prepilin-type N-terminal cleavage/methylation domain-containing protein [Nitrospirae bacterium]|nr:prepilin-type N-terminal cleavage/methylation domain-containing protein [Nitrospirota bacterium]
MKHISEKGFSLVEVLITIAIIIIMAAIAIPSLQGYLINENLKSAAREIKGDFFICKERAIAENRQYRIRFDIAANEFILQQCQGPDICLSTCSAPCGYVITQRKSPVTFGNDIQITNASFAAGSPTVTFQTRGIATGFGGSVRLVNGRGSTATITTNITGRVSINFNMK